MKKINLSQRPDYTHKHNTQSGRHGWLRLTPAYSVKIVDEIIDNRSKETRIFDPFSGTGTTALCASQKGYTAATLEINAFLVWLANVKTSRYSHQTIAEVITAADDILIKLKHGKGITVNPPPIHNIDRWWGRNELSFLCTLKAEIDQQEKESNRDLLLVAFCRTMIQISNASFNHQSMSFKDSSMIQNKNLVNDEILLYKFKTNLDLITSSAKEEMQLIPKILHGDAKDVEKLISNKYDLVITSPPYPNRMSYIRELRPYMYWLGFIREAKEAGELDWKTIGGTWGIATSRLSEWKPRGIYAYPDYLKNILNKISNAHKKHGQLMANYIAKYFEDIWVHLCSMKKILSKDAELHYIVGNSSFYDILLPVERIYADMFNELGMKKVKAVPIRKRSSKKELYEYDVRGAMA